MNRYQRASLNLVREDALARRSTTRAGRWSLWMRHLWQRPTSNRQANGMPVRNGQRNDRH